MTAKVFFMFWIIIVSPSGEYGGDMYRYPDRATCEKVRSINERANGGIPGFNVAERCAAIHAPDGPAINRGQE